MLFLYSLLKQNRCKHQTIEIQHKKVDLLHRYILDNIVIQFDYRF